MTAEVRAWRAHRIVAREIVAERRLREAYKRLGPSLLLFETRRRLRFLTRLARTLRPR